MKSFSGKFGATGAVLKFVELAMPFTDFIPTFTIAHFMRKYFKKNYTCKKVNIQAEKEIHFLFPPYFLAQSLFKFVKSFPFANF